MRYKIIIVLFVAVWGLLIFRLYQISIKSNFYYERLAKENVERKTYIKPVRGEIRDAKGRFLAINKIGFSLSIAPHLSRRRGELDAVIDTILAYFPDLNETVMRKVYKKHSSPYNHKYIKVIDFISYDQMLRAYAALVEDPRIHVEAETRRYYPYGSYAAHVVGYIGRSNAKENKADKVVSVVGRTGKSGLERYYNTLLQGELGFVLSKVNARNQALEVLEKKDPVSNRNLDVYLDMDLQTYIYKRLRKLAAVVVVMRTDGAVLAAVSNPSYDPNLFVTGISHKDWRALQENLGHPFTNKFIHAVYPPGSVIKMGVALAASRYGRDGNNTLDAHEFCKGYIQIDKSKHKFRCWSRWGHHDVDTIKSIRESCDVFYYNKGLKIGIDNISKTLHRIGLGIKTGLDLPKEYNGIIPDKKWKWKRYRQPWYKGETVIAAIGQGYDNVTPMQVARYTGFLATGKLVRPTFAKKINGKPVKLAAKTIPFNPRHMREIRQGMYEVCNVRSGTAYRTLNRSVTGLPFAVAGKTGTAQVVSIPQDVKKRVKEEDMAYFRKSHAWITTYAPFERPEYIVTVLVEHGGHGGSTAGPIAADIYKWLFVNGYFHDYPIHRSDASRTDDAPAQEKQQAFFDRLRQQQAASAANKPIE
jgi:penicillin-binding protein 2